MTCWFIVDLCKIVLRENHGVAFSIEPFEGKLGPYEEITVTLTAFSDMWGTYTDAVNCQVCAGVTWKKFHALFYVSAVFII